ncbi:exodeoxyribonuclease III, partial [Sutterella wadsworthensis]
IVISVYFPSGSSSDDRQSAKFRFLDAFKVHMDELRQSGREVIICGDINIAHKEIDLKNWKGNLDHSGFLPEERAWLDQRFGKEGWVDVFRMLDPRPERYTWWSQRGQARAKNVGWRIDYQITTPGIAALARNTGIFPDEKFSDHAPLWVDYDLMVEGAAQ